VQNDALSENTGFFLPIFSFILGIAFFSVRVYDEKSIDER